MSVAELESSLFQFWFIERLDPFHLFIIRNGVKFGKDSINSVHNCGMFLDFCLTFFYRAEHPYLWALRS